MFTLRTFISTVRVRCPLRISTSIRSYSTTPTSTPITRSFEDLKKIELELIDIKSPKSSTISKLNFLVKYNDYISISDINLDSQNYSKFFIHLLNTDINLNEIKGLGRLFKSLPSVSPNGLEIIKNCGILDSTPTATTGKSPSDIFINKYNDKLRLLTIDLLINHNLQMDAYNYCKLFELINPSSKHKLLKYYLKLSKFENFNPIINISPIDLIDSNLIHIYFRELLKIQTYSTEQKLKFYLLIVFKLLKLQDLNVAKYPKFSNNQLHSLNSIFLNLLNNEKSVNYKIYLSYFIKLFPQSIALLENLNLLSTNINQKRPVFIDALPTVNINSDLILNNELPNIEDLSILYSKYLNNQLPNSNQLKTLFKNYLINVRNYQYSESNNHHHPFSKSYHNQSILSTFLTYSFNRKINGFFKPNLTSNLILKYYTNPINHNINLDKQHKKQLESIVNYFSNVKTLNSNLPLSIELLHLFESKNIYLNSSCYTAIIDSFIRLDQFEDAKNFYYFLINHPVYSNILTWNDIIKYSYKYSWTFPDYLFEKEEQKNKVTLVYDPNYLINKLNPDDIIKCIDSLIEEEEMNSNQMG